MPLVPLEIPQPFYTPGALMAGNINVATKHWWDDRLYQSFAVDAKAERH